MTTLSCTPHSWGPDSGVGSLKLMSHLQEHKSAINRYAPPTHTRTCRLTDQYASATVDVDLSHMTVM